MPSMASLVQVGVPSILMIGHMWMRVTVAAAQIKRLPSLAYPELSS